MRSAVSLFAAAIVLTMASAALGGEPEPPAALDPAALLVDKPEPPTPRDPLKEIRQLLRTEKSILEKAEELDINLARRREDLKKLERQREVIDKDLTRFEARFKVKSQKLEAARALTRRRLRTLARLQRIKPYQLLFSGTSYAQVERQIRAISRMVDADKNRISAYKASLSEWKAKRTALVRRRTNLIRTETQMGYLIDQIRWDVEEKQALLKAVRNKASYFGQFAAEIRLVDKKLVDQVAGLRDRSQKRLWFEESKGRLTRRPVRGGRIVRRFGTRVHRKHKTKTFHPGLDLVPPEKWNGRDPVDVLAMYYGKVVYAKWLRGFGNTVIVDHTRGYMTLYGHLESIGVRPGQTVRTGAVLGTMGDSGSLFGKRLHLQVRQDGQAINPAPWLP